MCPSRCIYYRVHPHSVSQREDRDWAMWGIRRKYRLGWGALPLLRHSFKILSTRAKDEGPFGWNERLEENYLTAAILT